MLTSIQNPKVKYFHQLRQKKTKSESAKFLVEGIHLVSEALEAGLIDRVIYSENVLTTFEGKNLLGKLIASGLPLEESTKKITDFLSCVESPQGILASVRMTHPDLGQLFEREDPFIVVACGIQDPGNLGTLIRTADAVGASGFICTQGTVDPYNEKAIRASSGSIFHLNIVKYDDIIELISALKRRSISIISAAVDGPKTYFEINYSGPTALIIGSEGQGLPREVEKLSDETVRIPMPGRVESLNAAVSGAVILYESLRQRLTGGKDAVRS